jgi:hypothetical protein
MVGCIMPKELEQLLSDARLGLRRQTLIGGEHILAFRETHRPFFIGRRLHWKCHQSGLASVGPGDNPKKPNPSNPTYDIQHLAHLPPHTDPSPPKAKLSLAQ